MTAKKKSAKKVAKPEPYKRTRAEKIQWREQRQLWLAATDSQLGTLRMVQHAYDTMGKKFGRWLADEVDRVSRMVSGRHLSGDDK